MRCFARGGSRLRERETDPEKCPSRPGSNAGSLSRRTRRVCEGVRRRIGKCRIGGGQRVARKRSLQRLDPPIQSGPRPYPAFQGSRPKLERTWVTGCPFSKPSRPKCRSRRAGTRCSDEGLETMGARPGPRFGVLSFDCPERRKLLQALVHVFEVDGQTRSLGPWALDGRKSAGLRFSCGKSPSFRAARDSVGYPHRADQPVPGPYEAKKSELEGCGRSHPAPQTL